MFVIVNVETEMLYRKPGHYSEAVYDTIKGAKAACTRLNKPTGTQPFVVMDEVDYMKAYPVKMVKKINMMSGLEYEEAEGTPGFMSPASEAYWSM